MIHHIEYRTLANPKMRLVRRTDGAIWDNTNSRLATSPVYADTAITLTRDENINGIPIIIPSLLPSGEYDMILYDVVMPSNTDEAVAVYQFSWSGNHLNFIMPRILNRD